MIENWNKKIGKKGENQAKVFLRNSNYSIIESNFSQNTAEIDIIAKKEKTIYFFEVKTAFVKQSANINNYHPEERVNQKKKQKIYRLGEWYMNKKYPDYDSAFGVIAVLFVEDTDEEKIDIIWDY